MGYDYSRIQLDIRAATPLFEQIAARIREDIQQGALAVDDRLPTVRQLAQQLKINFNTVARAYRILDAEGLILSRQGQGSFVTSVVAVPPTDGEIREVPDPLVNPLAKLLSEIETVILSSGLDRDDVIDGICKPSKYPGMNHKPRKLKRTAYVRSLRGEIYLAVLQETQRHRRQVRAGPRPAGKKPGRPKA